MNRILAFALLITVAACQQNSDTYFKKLSSNHTNITFSNDLTVTDTFNAIEFEYIYNGGGVGAGDFNGDGLTDLYFSGNQVSSRLYLNQGNMQFEDITEQAGVGTDVWCTGVAVSDINEDGRPDIYVSVAGKVPPEQRKNLLFINQGTDENGIPTFVEKAAEFGLDDDGYSTQAAFFDYDLDGDNDMYLLTNALEKFNRNNLRPKRTEGEAESTDRLYRNNGDGTFTDVSAEAGILIEGYGLGVAISDLNFDGLPDVYAANDFLSNDLIWVNQGNGTFVNKAADYLKHQTHNGMGTDIADINNDQLPDIAVLDMLPEGNYREKIMLPKVNHNIFLQKRDLGYQDQYMRNTLQLHRGMLPDGSPRFSEIGQLAGLAATDWSWSVLFADYDNDGWKDAYITNGYRKDVTNLDYISYSSSDQMFGTAESKKQRAYNSLSELPDVKIKNYLFHNQLADSTATDLFKNVADEWGLGDVSFSNGAVYADLDQDGDLDLVVNNIDEPAFVYENKTTDRTQQHNYLRIHLQENSPNVSAYNAKVLVYAGDKALSQEFSPFRGYKSTVEEVMHFGLGAKTEVDSVVVYWLDGQVTKQSQVDVNQIITLSYNQSAANRLFQPVPATTAPLVQNLDSKATGIDYTHAQHDFIDFNTIRTMPHMLSKNGPPLTTGDINGDGLEDFFVGGNIDQPGTFFIQNQNGQFAKVELPFDAERQDNDALFFDADGDADLDLYVVSGGNHLRTATEMYQDRLYLNDGAGNFTPSSGLPKMYTSGAVVRAADVDGDGDQDLFVGGRVEAGNYPLSPRSYLLLNEGGRFSDQTPETLQRIGMVRDARWTDFDGNGEKDLLLVGEWMPITFFKNRNGQLEKFTPTIEAENGEVIAHTNGWWFHANAADLDRDGDEDYILGNLGHNSKLHASQKKPLQLLAHDFDENGAIDPLLVAYRQGEQYVMHQRDVLIDQIPGMKRRFPKYALYGEADLDKTLTRAEQEAAQKFEAHLLTSVWLENVDGQTFRLHELPLECQFSPLMASHITDLNQDGQLDVLAVGNFEAAETTLFGYYDASYGTVLLNDGHQHFHSLNPLQAGFVVPGDARSLTALRLSNGNRLLLAGQHGEALLSFRQGRKPLVD